MHVQNRWPYILACYTTKLIHFYSFIHFSCILSAGSSILFAFFSGFLCVINWPVKASYHRVWSNSLYLGTDSVVISGYVRGWYLWKQWHCESPLPGTSGWVIAQTLKSRTSPHGPGYVHMSVLIRISLILLTILWLNTASISPAVLRPRLNAEICEILALFYLFSSWTCPCAYSLKI